MEELGPKTEEQSSEFEKFEGRWARSEELCDVLRRLPGHMVMRSGMAGQRNKLLKRWDALEVPNLDDDSPSSDVRGALRRWIGDGETLIRYIIQIGDKPVEPAAGLRASEEGVTFEVIDSISEATSVSDGWCWPWEEKALAKVEGKKGRKIDVKRLTKYGVISAAVLYAIGTWVDEDE